MILSGWLSAESRMPIELGGDQLASGTPKPGGLFPETAPPGPSRQFASGEAARTVLVALPSATKLRAAKSARVGTFARFPYNSRTQSKMLKSGTRFVRGPNGY